MHSPSRCVFLRGLVTKVFSFVNDVVNNQWKPKAVWFLSGVYSMKIIWIPTEFVWALKVKPNDSPHHYRSSSLAGFWKEWCGRLDENIKKAQKLLKQFKGPLLRNELDGGPKDIFLRKSRKIWEIYEFLNFLNFFSSNYFFEFFLKGKEGGPPKRAFSFLGWFLGGPTRENQQNSPKTYANSPRCFSGDFATVVFFIKLPKLGVTSLQIYFI